MRQLLLVPVKEAVSSEVDPAVHGDQPSVGRQPTSCNIEHPAGPGILRAAGSFSASLAMKAAASSATRVLQRMRSLGIASASHKTTCILYMTAIGKQRTCAVREMVAPDLCDEYLLYFPDKRSAHFLPPILCRSESYISQFGQHLDIIPSSIDTAPELSVKSSNKYLSHSEKTVLRRYYKKFSSFFRSETALENWINGASLHEVGPGFFEGHSDKDSARKWLHNWVGLRSTSNIGLRLSWLDSLSLNGDNEMDILFSQLAYARRKPTGKNRVIDSRIMKIAGRISTGSYAILDSGRVVDAMVEIHLDYSSISVAVWKSAPLRQRIEDSITLRPIAFNLLTVVTDVNLVAAAADLSTPLCADLLTILDLIASQPSCFEVARNREEVGKIMDDPDLLTLQSHLTGLPEGGFDRVARILTISMDERNRLNEITCRVLGVSAEEFALECITIAIQQNCAYCAEELKLAEKVSEDDLSLIMLEAKEWVREISLALIRCERHQEVNSIDKLIKWIDSASNSDGRFRCSARSLRIFDWRLDRLHRPEWISVLNSPSSVLKIEQLIRALGRNPQAEPMSLDSLPSLSDL